MITICQQDNLLHITLNQPQSLNALSAPMQQQLVEALSLPQTDSTIAVVLLSGAGEKAFCAGGDVKAESQLTAQTAVDFCRQEQQVMDAIASCPVPVVCAIHGYTLGGGVTMALASDFVWAADSAKLSLPSLRLGLLPADGVIHRLVQAIGKANAFDLLITGRRITAQEALHLGLVQRVVPQQQLLEEARQFCMTIANSAPEAVRATTQAVRHAAACSLEESLALETQSFADLTETANYREAMDAFFQKRTPSFR